MSIVNPNNQKEMSEENQNEPSRSPMRISEIHRGKCDCCLDSKDCMTIGLPLKQVTFCAACWGKVMGNWMVHGMVSAMGFKPAPDGYQPEPDIHDIEMVGSELWIKDKEEK